MSDYREDCDFCSVTAGLSAETPLRERVYVGPHWRVRAHRSALPGWLLLIPRRHIESLHELTGEEAAELGQLLRDSTAALVASVGAVKSYVMQFAEGTPHAHFSLVPRMPDLPSDRTGAAVSAYNSKDTPIPESRRDEVATAVAAAWPRSAANEAAEFAADAPRTGQRKDPITR
jgi:diadenosine tetraphosphate (Ap4A) HIT family hydrolase